MRRRPVPYAAAAVVVLAATACGTAPPAENALPVVANFYPVQFLAERIGGAAVAVTGLTPDGAEPHSVEFTGRTRAAMAEAAVVVYLGEGFQPQVEEAVAQLGGDARVVDLLRGHDLLAPEEDHEGEGGHEAEKGHEHGADPHIWLDPVLTQGMVRTIADAFATARPERADVFRANASALTAELAEIHRFTAEATRDCASRTLVVNHAAFGYLAERYGLEQVALAGFSSEQEPDPRTLAEISALVDERNVATVFGEEEIEEQSARTVAAETGAELGLLRTVEFTPEPGSDYLDVLRANAESLATGLDCA